MIRFTAGFGVILLAIVSIDAIGEQREIIRILPAILWRWILLIVVAPSFIVFFAALVVNLFRPLQMFKRKVVGLFGPMRFGFLLGLIVALLIPFALVGLGRWISEAFIPALVTAVVSIPMLTLVARRCLPGYCVRCGYDIRCSLDADRCPECGTRPMGAY
ncbi:MAG: hypothetical protein DHS20C16_21740 [Phycisphaerae bacterium]|nr:MAG: hypothetical protein DHS20C16_21740 [Phycisphaerae bacterium]